MRSVLAKDGKCDTKVQKCMWNSKRRLSKAKQNIKKHENFVRNKECWPVM